LAAFVLADALSGAAADATDSLSVSWAAPTGRGAFAAKRFPSAPAMPDMKHPRMARLEA